MPIGPITPGSYVTVTPDASPSLYASVQAPTATMPVIGADIQALTLVALNIQKALDTAKLDLAGGTMTGALTLDNSAASLVVPSGGTINVQAGGAITLGNTTSSISGSGEFDFRSGRVRETIPYRPADAATITIDATTPYRHVILATPALSPRTVVMKSTGTTNPIVSGLVCRLNAPPGIADGHKFTVTREDATVIAEIHGYTVKETGVDVNGSSWIEVYWDGSAWRGLTATGYIVTGASW